MNSEQLAANIIRSKQFAIELRRLADFVEAHPEVPAPMHVMIDQWASDKSDMTAFARAARNIQKDFADSWIEFKWKVGDYFKYCMTIQRGQVCRQVPTGEVRHYEAVNIPARDEPVSEWVCDDKSFLVDDAELVEDK